MYIAENMFMEQALNRNAVC